jgi:hypothetical protein
VRYRELCEASDELPLFMKDWWLDATCGIDGWDAVAIEDGSNPRGVFVYRLKSGFGFHRMVMAPLTPSLGPFVFYPKDFRDDRRQSLEIDTLSALIERLPEFAELRMRFHHSISSWLPFYWAGFRQTTRYTYRITGLDDLAAVNARMSKTTRAKLRKAASQVRIEASDKLALLHSLCGKTFQRQGIRNPISLPFLERLDDACRLHDARDILLAFDGDGRPHAGAYIVYDDRNAYYLLGGADPDLRKSDAQRLLLWEGIRRASARVETFDFEGSMVKPIEWFFRSFGAQAVPYHYVRKTNHPILKVLRSLQSGIGADTA